MRKILVFTILGLFVVILGVIAVTYATNLLRKPEEEIKANILELTPIGTSMDDVINVIESNESWVVMYISDRGGVPQGELGKVGDAIGEKTISVILGSYRNIFKTYVVFWWAFDENSKLIEVFIEKAILGF